MTMDNYIVSIIVPLYNTRDYIDKCIQSILTQKLSGIEAVFVDDGSPDDTADIVREYCEKYPDFKLYHKENGGLGSARNYGIERANGKYILFLDSDDYLSEDGLLKLVEVASEHDLDVIQGTFKMIEGDKVGLSASSEDMEKATTGREWLLAGKIIYGACFCLYRREFLISKKLYFMEGVYHEDMDFTLRATWNANRIMSKDIFFYWYVDHPGSITKSKNIKHCTDYYDVACFVDKWVQTDVDKEAYEGFFREYLAFLYSHVVNMTITQGFKIKQVLDVNDRRGEVLKHLKVSVSKKYKLEYILLKLHMYWFYSALYKLTQR